MKELLKWAHGLGVGAVYALLMYVQTQAASGQDVMIKGAIIAVLVRVLGLAVTKLGPQAA